MRPFSYDGAGNVTADTRGGTTHYLYDLAGRLIAEADNTGQTLREYIWLDDLPLAVVSDVNTASPNLYYVHADHLNRPIKMTDGFKAAVWDAVYLPFGGAISITGAASNNLRFPGQYFLIESGLHYNWYRHYDPTLGRYVQPDPLEYVNGPNRYNYALNDPVSQTDPTGQFAPIIVGIGVFAAYILTPSVANAPGPGDITTPSDDLAPFANAATAAACLSPYYWWSLRSMGGGIRAWRNGPGIDWHRFKVDGKWVNRPHWEPGGQTKHHWPWN